MITFLAILIVSSFTFLAWFSIKKYFEYKKASSKAPIVTAILSLVGAFTLMVSGFEYVLLEVVTQVYTHFTGKPLVFTPQNEELLNMCYLVLCLSVVLTFYFFQKYQYGQINNQNDNNIHNSNTKIENQMLINNNGKINKQININKNKGKISL